MLSEEKYFWRYILLIDQILLPDRRSPLLLELLDNMCVVIIYFPVCDAINFEINLKLKED